MHSGEIRQHSGRQNYTQLDMAILGSKNYTQLDMATFREAELHAARYGNIKEARITLR